MMKHQTAFLILLLALVLAPIGRCAEFYRQGRGRQQVDPTGGGALRCGIYHIPYFTSEDGEMPILYVSMPKIEAVHTK